MTLTTTSTVMPCSYGSIASSSSMGGELSSGEEVVNMKHGMGSQAVLLSMLLLAVMTNFFRLGTVEKNVPESDGRPPSSVVRGLVSLFRILANGGEGRDDGVSAGVVCVVEDIASFSVLPAVLGGRQILSLPP